MITLDGSTLEGGGQLVRVALCLSAICTIPIRVINIRAGRGPGSFQKRTRKSGGAGRGNASHSDPPRSESKASKKSATGGGLKESHLAALTWLALECSATVEGAEVNSLEVVFKPKPKPRKTVRAGSANRSPQTEPEVIELKNPGSIWLIWQAIFPYIVFAVLRQNDGDDGMRKPDEPAFRIRLRGGTNVPKSPSGEYMQQVFLPLCERIGLPRVHVHVVKRGWTTGAPEIGEVDISVFGPGHHREASSPTGTIEDAAALNGTAAHVQGQGQGQSNTAARGGVSSGGGAGPQQGGGGTTGFHLPPFHIGPREPSTIESVSFTTICGSSQTQTLLHTRLRDSLRLIPRFSNPGFPITAHPSCSTDSGDERRLYILLTAHVSGGYVLGRDYLGPGRKMHDDADRKRMVDEAVNQVVRDFKRQVDRGSCVDEFAEDQLVIFQALADGASRVDPGRVSERAKAKARARAQAQDIDSEVEIETGSLHTRTVRWVCQEILGTVSDGVGGCQGGGLLRSEIPRGGVDEVTERLSDLGVEEREEE
jgi:RNA 3'-terminal phosphate cyclase (ATP)